MAESCACLPCASAKRGDIHAICSTGLASLPSEWKLQVLVRNRRVEPLQRRISRSSQESRSPLPGAMLCLETGRHKSGSA